MPRIIQWIFGLLIAALLIGGPLLYAHYRHAEFRNFHVVKEGILVRSGQMTRNGLKCVINDYRIKSIITLRDSYTPGEGPPDLDEEEYCKAQGLNYYRLTPRTWWASTGPAPVEGNVQKFLEIMRNPDNYPVLVHCFAGIHRTGAYCAIFRMEFDHWSNEKALEEMKQYGYVNLAEEFDILGYLEQYKPSWKIP